MKRNKILAVPLAIALGREIIAPGGEEAHPHTEKEIILAPEPTGAEADVLRPFVTPPEDPWLTDFALRVLKPEELEGWWVNTSTTRSGGLVTVLRTQTCGEARFKEPAIVSNPNTNQEFTKTVYLNEDYCISLRTRKMCEQLQQWLLQRRVVTQILLRTGDNKGQPPDYCTPLSAYAPIYDDADGV
ncbi:MAG TPA: hypothetical protein VFA85_17465 [Terriglobales bacterium]|nr:hypothetical protein [Terriglobales bacterium]